MPFSPTNSTPSGQAGTLPDVTSSGRFPPWYQLCLTAGMPSRASCCQWTTSQAGAVSGLTAGPSASIVFGTPSFSAQYGKSFQWLPRSGSTPPPYTQNLYHLGPGTYSLLNGRCSTGPCQRSQCSHLGTGSSFVGFDPPPQSRETHTWASVTGPIAPPCTSSTTRR